MIFPSFFQSGLQGYWTLLLMWLDAIRENFSSLPPVPLGNVGQQFWTGLNAVRFLYLCRVNFFLQIAGTAKFGSRKFVENNFRQLAGFKTIFLSYKFIFGKFPGPRRKFAKKNSSKSSRLYSCSPPRRPNLLHFRAKKFYLQRSWKPFCLTPPWSAKLVPPDRGVKILFLLHSWARARRGERKERPTHPKTFNRPFLFC